MCIFARKMNQTEARIQQDIFKYFHNNYCLKHHNPRMAIFSVPNESKSKIETIRKKAMGMMAGVSDLIVVIPEAVLFIEIKTAAGTQSPNQKDFQEIVSNLGYHYEVVRSLDDFKNLLTFFNI